MQTDGAATVVVTSLNQVKIDAVKDVALLFVEQPVEMIGIQAESLVSETPIGDVEAITGCRNRILAARSAYPEASYFVSIEGAIDYNPYGAFVYSWVLVEQRQPNRRALGCSAKVLLPTVFELSLQRNLSLSNLTQRLYSTDENVSELGTNGVVTKGTFARRDEFESALRCAFGFLFNDENYSTQVSDPAFGSAN
ncbi:inosine/xanthosine triphosphatase [Rhizobium miluonense]|jgi:non-canonical (house-cleaning) NTP pyrophosphatase|uniref:inosine/xanthosine triphosphatase n=1 Tax=Rhizobium miluonense TaxID=411945 RepID=A0ABU1SX40_9HYPH|nr:inosine/xanthosine triphosphatase [Rhizobium miluonense]MDR6903558.1 non-canonical (house-cleaning) NTP pyrophosphatase [Rhizobium miluonense]